MWRAACALISCGYTILGGASSPDVISTNLNNINDLKFYHAIRGNLELPGTRCAVANPATTSSLFRAFGDAFFVEYRGKSSTCKVRG
jgi:hypothetical protein